MFYKEWSTDTFWAPETGLLLLPPEHSVPTIDPQIFQPCFDPEQLQKLEVTIRKIGAYLEKKAGASTWWKLWLEEAWKNVKCSDPQAMSGMYTLWSIDMHAEHIISVTIGIDVKC